MGKLYLLNTVLRTGSWVYFKGGTNLGFFRIKKNISMWALRVNIIPNICRTRNDVKVLMFQNF